MLLGRWGITGIAAVLVLVACADGLKQAVELTSSLFAAHDLRQEARAAILATGKAKDTNISFGEGEGGSHVDGAWGSISSSGHLTWDQGADANKVLAAYDLADGIVLRLMAVLTNEQYVAQVIEDRLYASGTKSWHIIYSSRGGGRKGSIRVVAVSQGVRSVFYEVVAVEGPTAVQ